MHTSPAPHSDPTEEPAEQSADIVIPQLVANVYEAATVNDRAHLIEELLRPLGVLSLVAIAGGIFAKIRFRSGWQDLKVPLEDLQPVLAADVIALVDHAQQVSVETVDGLAQMLTASPALSSSAAAALLVAALIQRAARRGIPAIEAKNPGLP